MEKQVYRLVVFATVFTSFLFGGVTFASSGWVMYDNFNTGVIDNAKWVTEIDGSGNAPTASGGGVSFTGGGGLNWAESTLVVSDFGTAIGAQADLQLISFIPANGAGWAEGQTEIEMDLGNGYGAAIEILSEDGVSFSVEMAIEYDFGSTHSELTSQEFAITAGQIVKAGIVFHDNTDSVDFYINGSLLWSYDQLHVDYDAAIAAGFSLDDLIIGSLGDNGQYAGFADNMELYCVPEPATITILGLGIAVILRKRKV